jgi:hypothetical protein
MRNVREMRVVGEEHEVVLQHQRGDPDVVGRKRRTETDDLAARYSKLLADKRSEEAAKAARSLVEAQFAKRAGVGFEMAIRSVGAFADAEEIAASCMALAGDLLAALK